MRALYESWHTSKARLQKSSSLALKEFNQKLVRRLSVETGILERLYDIDRGTTEALVTHGFVEELVARSNTDIEPSRLIDILRDQESAIKLTIDCVANNRVLTKGFIHELHSTLVRHQQTTTAIDEFGNRHEIELLKGKFKQAPNNPKRPNGVVHEYCPPVHVESEIDNLLMWLSEYKDEDPILVAAWFHHRFTQIHPYQDGNGRVVRALTTLILLKADLLPLVLDRDLRIPYIESLENADRGDLSKLAQLFASLERTAILQALSVDVDAELSSQRSLTAAVLENLADKFSKRKEEKSVELRKVNAVAQSLRLQSKKIIESSYKQLSKFVDSPFISISEGGHEQGNGHWYKTELITFANKEGTFINFTENHYFLKSVIKIKTERLVFVTSFHHIGRELSGIMEATAFSQLESFDDTEDRSLASLNTFACSLEPFVFTYKTDLKDIAESYSRWLDAAVAVALKEYGDRL